MSNAILIHALFLVLGYFAAYLIVERGLFVASHRPADGLALEAVLIDWRLTRRIAVRDAIGPLGWLDQLLDTAGHDAEALAASVQREREMAERFGPDVLKMVRDVAMAVGLLAAISSLVDNSATPASDENPLAMVAQVFDGTARGLVIAVVAYVADWWLGGRLRLRIEQIEAVQDGLVALRLGPGPRPAAGTDPRTRTAGAPDARGASQPLRDPTRCEGAARHSIPKKIPLAEPAPEPDPPDEDVVGYALEEYIP